ncbi:unnamed protein product [marine sediment metagenome]|uniref:Uncharacterized protein n=1 Tax=marine sediment metagenome TaxID=412755 RepID=X1SQR5_9ZZZZ
MYLVTPYLSKSYNQLRSLAQKLGINFFGMADIRRIKQGFYLPTSKTKGLNYGIVLGKPLSRYVLNTLKKGPNRIYLRHYLGVNRVLDKVAYQLARFIAQQGYRALVIPASRIINPVRKPVDNGETNNHSSHHDIRELSNGVNRQRLIGEVSHRQLGYLAGLGWIGGAVS